MSVSIACTLTVGIACCRYKRWHALHNALSETEIPQMIFTMKHFIQRFLEFIFSYTYYMGPRYGNAIAT